MRLRGVLVDLIMIGLFLCISFWAVDLFVIMIHDIISLF